MQVGNLCWVPDKGLAFVAGKVKEIKSGDVIVVERDDGRGTVECKKSEAHERPPQRTTKQEMDDLTPLNMAEVLENVSVLFHQPQAPVPGKGPAKIYSSVGPVLITMNPFEKLPVTSDAWVQAYHSADNVTSKRLGPHAFRTAEEALRGLSKQPKQAIVICGESGAGKTYTNRDMLAYLCDVARGEESSDPDQITQSCMVLESFGNASTKRNDNSSRFGRLTSLFFNDQSQILGCGTDAYLLERSRINGPPESERNYHIFYQLLRSGTATSYGLDEDPTKHAFTKDGANVKQPGVYDGCADDKADFEELKRKMSKAGFSDDVLVSIFDAVAAVLHLGNVTFTGSTEASVDPALLEMPSKLLGVDTKTLAKFLTHKLVPVPKSAPIERIMTKAQGEAMCDTVAKMVYSRIFDHIVGTVDKNLKGRCEGGGKCIGLLDIFGFEDMDTNGFEQIFINFTNERIQHLFNTVMFDREKVAYEKEGINSDFLRGPKNIDCVNLFLARRPPGIVQLLSDACSQGREDGVDGEHFVSVLNRTFKSNNYFKVCDFKDVNAVLKRKGLGGKNSKVQIDYKACFVIKHYAGEILYTVQDFVPKSRDSLSSELTQMLVDAKKPFVRGLFECDANQDSKNASTIGHKFRDSLESLAETLDAGDALFVRCIKSNHAKVPNVVDRPIVIEQLTLGGVVAALEVRAAGLPDRLLYEDFCSEFGFMELGEVNPDPKEGCKEILRLFVGEREALNHFKFGTTKVFMKSGILSFLRGCVNFKISHCARRIQRRLWFTRVGKIDKAWQCIDEAETWANTRGIGELKAVKAALDAARSKCRPAYDALQDAKKTHQGDMNAVASALESFSSSIRPLLIVADQAAEVVTKYEKRKAELETGMNVRVSRATTQTNEILNKLKLIEEDAEECADVADKAEIETCRNAIREARAKIDKLQKEIFPQLKQTGNSGLNVDLEMEPWDLPDPCPQMTGLVGEADNLFQAAEKTCYAVLRVRREFAKAMEDLMPSVEEQRQILESLRGAGHECVAEGLTNASDAITKSDRLNIVLEQIQAASKEPELFRTKAGEFVEAVKVAQELVEKGKEELARRARERAERAALSDKLDELSDKVNAAKEGLLKQKEMLIGGELSEDSAGVFAEIVPQVARLRLEAGSPLEEWKPKVEEAYSKGMSALEEMETFVKDGAKKSKEAFEARRAMFGK